MQKTIAGRRPGTRGRTDAPHDAGGAGRPGAVAVVPGVASALASPRSGEAGVGGGPRAGPPRLHPAPAPRPAPTVELEVADALALSVSGRGAAEAAPQGLALAARRPPTAGEGHRQQPQASHPPSHWHPHPGPNRLRPPPSTRRHPGPREGGSGPAWRARPRETDSPRGQPLGRRPSTPTNQRPGGAGRAEARVPSLPGLVASSRLFDGDSEGRRFRLRKKHCPRSCPCVVPLRMRGLASPAPEGLPGCVCVCDVREVLRRSARRHRFW